MQGKYKVLNQKIYILRKNKETIYNIASVKGACLKVLIDNKDKILNVADICLKADEIIKSFGKPPFKDRGRDVRSLNAEGIIESPKKGAYVFNGNFGESLGEDFPLSLKEKILKRDGYKCQICQFGDRKSRDLVVDHIIPKPKGGKATLENGMTLCTRCNNIKSNHDVRSFGKKMFEKFLKTAIKKKLKKEINFFKEILSVFEKHSMK